MRKEENQYEGCNQNPRLGLADGLCVRFSSGTGEYPRNPKCAPSENNRRDKSDYRTHHRRLVQSLGKQRRPLRSEEKTRHIHHNHASCSHFDIEPVPETENHRHRHREQCQHKLVADVEYAEHHRRKRVCNGEASYYKAIDSNVFLHICGHRSKVRKKLVNILSFVVEISPFVRIYRPFVGEWDILYYIFHLLAELI